MDRNDFGKGIKKIQLAYTTTFTSEKLAFWWQKLQVMDAKTYLDRIDTLIQEKPYIPNVAEILDNSNISKQYTNYEQRSYSDDYFDKFYVN